MVRRLVKKRPIREAEDHPALDLSTASADLEEIARRQERPVECAQNEEPMHSVLDEAPWDWVGRKRQRGQQHRREQQRADRYSPRNSRDEIR